MTEKDRIKHLIDVVLKELLDVVRTEEEIKHIEIEPNNSGKDNEIRKGMLNALESKLKKELIYLLAKEEEIEKLEANRKKNKIYSSISFKFSDMISLGSVKA